MSAKASSKPRAQRTRLSVTRVGHAPPEDSGQSNGQPAQAPMVGAAEWRSFVGRWLESAGCTVGEAARGDWEVVLSPVLQRRWRRQRVRLVFDPQRPTLPRGAWFTAPGSGAGRKILEAARGEPLITRRTALPRVPGAPPEGLAAVCKVRGLTWGQPRLGPVRYERRVAFRVEVTLWGGLPAQEPWVLLLGHEGQLLEWERERALHDVRVREGLYQIGEELDPETRSQWIESARRHLDELLSQREREWEISVGRQREDELKRLSAFFAARIEEEEERSRRRTNGDDHEMEDGDTTTLKLDWERRAAEVRQRWALWTEIRMWGVEEWAWPVADIEQELKAGAVHVRLKSLVDVARGLPSLPPCPGCGAPAEMLVRSRGAVSCALCTV
ncbi:MAG TPA: hypothetical protein VEY91_05035 [Candidatus Limnocylindria bacterium]|nr:hypothetical protein [Candidatus Limnocylindria bacterium]